MKCTACDTLLTDFETTRKIVRGDRTIFYPDLCNRCFKESGLFLVAVVVERQDLTSEGDVIEDFILEE